MILTAMGPAETLHHDSTKIFAMCDALFSGTILLTSAATAAAPALHWKLHIIRLDEDAEERR